MIKLTAEQQKVFNNYKKSHPKVSDEKIISALVHSGQITLTQEQKNSILTSQNNKFNDYNSGLKLEKTTTPSNNGEKVVFLQSGRKVVVTKTKDGKDVYKYYAADGKQLAPDYFKKQEGTIRISADGTSYTATKDGKTVTKKTKDPLTAKLDQQQAQLNKTKKGQGFLGKSWDWFKNTTGIGDGSDKAQKQIDAERALVQQVKSGKVDAKKFKEVTGIEYTKENAEKFKTGNLELKSTEKIKGYEEGQEMATDMAADMTAGIVSFGAYTLAAGAIAAAPFSGGSSLVVIPGALAVATGSAALVKSGIKYADAKSAGREYTAKEFKKDAFTGSISGVLAPVTAGFGGAVGKGVAVKVGGKVIATEMAEVAGKDVAQQGFMQTFKGLILKPGSIKLATETVVKDGVAKEVTIGGTKASAGFFLGEAATSGAAWGGVDGVARTTYDQVESGEGLDGGAIAMSAVEGTIGGAVAGVGFGGAMKGIGKLWGKVFGRGKANAKVETKVETETKHEHLPTETPKPKAEVVEGAKSEQPQVHNTEVTTEIVAEHRPPQKVAGNENSQGKILTSEQIIEVKKSYKDLLENDVRLTDDIKHALSNESNVEIMQKRLQLYDELKYEFRLSDEKYNQLIKDLPIESIDEKLKLYRQVKDDPEFSEYIEKLFLDRNCKTIEDIRAIKKAEIEFKLKQEEEIRQNEAMQKQKELEHQQEIADSYTNIKETFDCDEVSLSFLYPNNVITKVDEEKFIIALSKCVDKAKQLDKKPNLENLIEMTSLIDDNRYKVDFLKIEALFEDNPNISKLLKMFKRASSSMITNDEHQAFNESKLNLLMQILKCKEPDILNDNTIWSSQNSILEKIFKNLDKNNFNFRFESLKLAANCQKFNHSDFILRILDRIDSKEKYDIVIKMLQMDTIWKNKYSVSQLSQHLFTAKNFNAKEMNVILDKILSNNELLESEFIKNNMAAILETIEFIESLKPLIEIIISNKNLYENESIIKCFYSLIQTSDSEIAAKNRLAMFNFILEKPEMLKDNELLENYLHSIVHLFDDEIKTKAQLYSWNEIIKNKYNELDCKDQLYDYISCIRTIEGAKNYFSGLDLILKNKFPTDMLWCFDKKISLDFAKYVSQNEHLLTNKVFMDKCFKKILQSLAMEDTLSMEKIVQILNSKELCTTQNLGLLVKLGEDRISQEKEIQDIIFKWIVNEKIERKTILALAKEANKENVQFIDKYIDNPNFEPKSALISILEKHNLRLDPLRKELIEQLCEDVNFPKSLISEIAECYDMLNKDLVMKLITDKNIKKENIPLLARLTSNNIDNTGLYHVEDIQQRIKLIDRLIFDKDISFPQDGIASFIKSGLITDPADARLLDKQFMQYFKELVAKNATGTDMKLADAFIEFRGKLNFDELSQTEKRNFLYKILEQKNNISAEDNSGILSLIPKNEQEYASIIEKLTTELNMNLKPLSVSESNIFVNELKSLIEIGSTNFETKNIKALCENITRFIPEVFGKDKAIISDELVLILEKVMKNKSFAKLSDKDKQLLVLSTLLQAEKKGYTASDKAFDAYYIAQKLNFTREDANKISAIVESSDLIKEFMATSRTKTVIDGFRREQTIEGVENANLFDLAAFRLQNSNDFELAQILYSAKEPDGLTRHFDKLLQNRIREIKSNNFVMPQIAKNIYESQAKPVVIWREGKPYQINVVHSNDVGNFYAYLHTPEAAFASGGGRSANLANFDIFGRIKNDKIICVNYISNEYKNLVAEHGFVIIPRNNTQHVLSGNDIYSLSKDTPSMLIEYFRDRGAKNGYGYSRYNERTKASTLLKEILYPEYAKLVQELNTATDLINQRYNPMIESVENALKKKIRQLTGKENPSHEEYKSIMNHPEIVELQAKIREFRTQKTTALETIPPRKKIRQFDEDYIKRYDAIISRFEDEPMTIEGLSEFDKDMANAYKELLSRNASDPNMSDRAVLKANGLHHNEALVSDIDVGPIYTTDLNTIPIEYLELAETRPMTFLVIDR